jgi:hypothetical protein
MLKCIKNNTPFLPRWWIRATLNYSAHLLLTAVLATSFILAYTIINFKINTDLTDMVSSKLPFRKIRKDYARAFPRLSDTIVVVIDADTPEFAMDSQKRLANRLLQTKGIFKTVYIPGGGSFFERNGLLYMNVQELERLTDHLADAQPFLALLSRDFSFSGLFSVLEKVIQESADYFRDNNGIILLFDQLCEAFENTMANKPCLLSWQEIVLGRKATKEQLRRFIVLQPHLDYSVLYPGKIAINTIRSVADELRLRSQYNIKVRITGNVALKHDDLLSVQNGIGTAAAASLILVGLVLYVGLGSCRLVFVSLLTLITGLIWTMGFAIAFVGHLNLISITFAVLFIGLGIDYSIQFCLRYREFIVSGHSSRDAVISAALGVSNALLLCTITTAIGFYAFVPTAYAGASELGIISGTGMFINLFTNMTVLPALLNVIPPRKSIYRSLPGSKAFSVFPDKHPGAITVCAAVLGLGSAMLLPKVFFDFNPLNLSNPAAESVVAAKELFKSEKTAPWTIAVLAGSRNEASELAAELRNLDEVGTTITIADFIPENQTERLDIISDIALFMPSFPKGLHIAPQRHAQKLAALKNFEKTLKNCPELPPEPDGKYSLALRRLNKSIKNYNAFIGNSQEAQRLLDLLEKSLLTNLTILLQNLEGMLQPHAFEEPGLPMELTQRFASRDGRYRIQVFSHENINDNEALKRFVSSVRKIAPDATAAPVTILESGRAIVSAFRRATLWALVGIIIFLLLVLRNISEVVLLIIPLLLAVLLTAAASVLLNIPFNFANIIVVPLLLGVGVDYGIHIIYRLRTDTVSKANVLETSTARAVLFSALTTVMSFSSLSFLSHRGTASMGKLLALCIGFIILSTLMILPALLKFFKNNICRQ